MPMEQERRQEPQAHFLVVTFPAQGHINPARHLARRLVRATGARVTISTAVSAHRKMFPSAADEHHSDGEVSYMPYSDGYDDGFDRDVHDHDHYMAQIRLVGSRTLSAIMARLRDGGRPATCVVYTLLLPWAAATAREHGVPAALYWIQPATVLAAYFHYFRGTACFDKAIAAAAKDPWADVRVPGLPEPLRVRDLPSFLTVTSGDDPYAWLLDAFREIFDTLRCEASATKPAVLANTFQEMEPEAVASVSEHLNVIPIGPVLSFLDDAAASATSNDLFKNDEKRYLEWLDAKPARSVVYISFGSLSVMSPRQIAEIARGMQESGKPFLWVLRRDNRKGGVAGAGEEELAGEEGVVVEWCDQVKVLSHPAVGCFVTHCGWNSTLESVACGVPVVGVPQWTDQGTNAWLVERRLGTGVRASAGGKDGVLEAAELRRCLEMVMAEAVRAKAEAVRAKAEAWKEKARAAVANGGSSERNLRAFVGEILGGN